VFFEVPAVELEEPFEVGDALPILRWADSASDAEVLATQALALACVLTGDDVAARPRLREWAQAATMQESARGEDLFDRELTLSIERSGPNAALRGSRDVSGRAELDSATSEARATELATLLFEHGGVQGGSVDDVLVSHSRRTLVELGGTVETITRFSSIVWEPRAGRVALGVGLASVRAERNGHVSSVTVPLVRLADDGQRVTSAVAETEAEALFVQKVDAEIEVDGISVEDPVGELWLPTRDAGESSEVMWHGSYVGKNDRGVVARRTPYLMSLTDADAPLIEL